jgi:hypothetical protein
MNPRGQSYDLMFSDLVSRFPRRGKSFPRYGKNRPIFSTLWKKFSTLWKKFSTLWKKSTHFFHAMEKVFHTVEVPEKSIAAALLLALAAAGCSERAPELPTLPDDQPMAVSRTVSTNRIRIGDPVDLAVTAIHREGTSVAFPNLEKGKDVVVRESSVQPEALPNGLLRTVAQIRFTSMTVTNHVVGEGLPILLSSPDGVTTSSFPFVSLEVVSSLKPGEIELRPAKADGLAQWPAPPSRIAWFALAALAVLVAGLLALRKFLTTPRTILHMPPPKPPHRVALDALDALRAKGWIEALNVEPFYVELSSIVRRYLEGRFGLRAPERTTEEFMRDAMDSSKLSAAHRLLVGGFLEQSDLVKFARHAPGAADMRNALDSAAALVRETLPEGPP